MEVENGQSHYCINIDMLIRKPYTSCNRKKKGVDSSDTLKEAFALGTFGYD